MKTDSLIATPEKHTQTLNYASRSRQRFGMFLALCGALFFVAIVRMFFLATADLTDGVAQGAEGCKWQYNVIPAIRGRILDVNGTPLAWSERVFLLVYEKPESPDKIPDDMAVLANLIEIPTAQFVLKSQHSREGKVVLKQNLTASEIERLGRGLPETAGRFRVDQQFLRHIAPVPDTVSNMIGRTWQNGRKQVGTSGFEHRFNQALTGVDGYYRVLVDKHGNWVPGTWEELRKPREGFDKYINLDLSTVGR